MDVIYLLVPVSLVLVTVIAAGFVWANRTGQFDDLERHGRDIFLEADQPPLSGRDAPDAPSPGPSASDTQDR